MPYTITDSCPHTGRTGFTDLEKDLLALPTQLSGLGIPDPTKTSNDNFRSSEHVSAPLTAIIPFNKRWCIHQML